MGTHDLTVETTHLPEGYAFRRSDGEGFYLLGIEGTGNAVLYRGEYSGVRPKIGIVEFDYTVADKLAAARTWILAHPEHPK